MKGIVKKRLAKPVSGVALEYNTSEQEFSLDVNGGTYRLLANTDYTSNKFGDFYNSQTAIKENFFYTFAGVVDEKFDKFKYFNYYLF